MAINNKPVADVVTAVQNADTTEASFRTGVTDIADQVDDNQILLNKVRGMMDPIGTPTSLPLDRLSEIRDVVTSNISTYEDVARVENNGTVTLVNQFVTIFHTGTGTVTINVDDDTPDGAAFYIATEGVLTIAYSGAANSRGISLGNATKLASGAYNETADSIYFSETVY